MKIEKKNEKKLLSITKNHNLRGLTTKHTNILSLDSQEHGVGQFPILDQVIKIVQMLQRLCPGIRAANCIEEPMLGHYRDQLFKEQKQQGA